MPIYAYQCQACGHELEAIQKISDVPLSECPQCGKSELRKMLTAPAFRLSGSGWYETDFKKDRDKKKNLAGERDSSGTKGSDSGSSSGGDGGTKKESSTTSPSTASSSTSGTN